MKSVPVFFAALATLTAIATPAVAAPIKPVGVTASSTYVVTEGTGSYDPTRTADGKAATSWFEGEAGSGLGAWIEYDLGAPTLVKQIKLWAGDWSTFDYWSRANRPKELELKFSDGTTQVVTLKNEKLAQSFAIDGGGKTTTSVRIKVKAIYDGSTWLDTGLAEVQLFGDSAPALTATSSTVAVEDGDGNYAASNVIDGLSDTMWCEGDKGSGAGQWIEVNLGASRSVSSLSLINGMGSSMVLWMKANQTTSLVLTFSDGATETVAIDRPSFRLASYTFPAHTTSKVRVTIAAVKAGAEFNDTCVSELSFGP